MKSTTNAHIPPATVHPLREQDTAARPVPMQQDSRG